MDSEDICDALSAALQPSKAAAPEDVAEQVTSAVNDLLRAVQDRLSRANVSDAIVLLQHLHDAFIDSSRGPARGAAALVNVGWDITEPLLALLQQLHSVQLGGSTDTKASESSRVPPAPVLPSPMWNSVLELRALVRAVLFRICEVCTPREVLLTLLTHFQHLQMIAYVHSLSPLLCLPSFTLPLLWGVHLCLN
jgi:hypothetical protein